MPDSDNDDMLSKILEWERIIAEFICTSTTDPVVKECLRNLDPTKNTKYLKQIFKRCRKELLQKTLNHLGHHPVKITKDELVDALLLG